MKLNPVEKTEKTGKGKLNLDALAHLKKSNSSMEILKSFSEKVKESQFVHSYLKHSYDDYIHPQFNLTGTVSGRLSGFSPNLQQLSKDYSSIMECFVSRPGNIFIGGDFQSIEPAVAAHYSGDLVLKEILDNKWDIYLELCESIFGPEIASQYDRLDLEGSKKRLKKDRVILKVVHLSSMDGATDYSLSRQLWKDTDPYHLAVARKMLNSYWRKFHKLKEFGPRLRISLSKQGLLYNGIGRPLYFEDTKDIANRFIQSTAHDCLVLFNY